MRAVWTRSLHGLRHASGVGLSAWSVGPDCRAHQGHLHVVPPLVPCLSYPTCIFRGVLSSILDTCPSHGWFPMDILSSLACLRLELDKPTVEGRVALPKRWRKPQPNRSPRHVGPCVGSKDRLPCERPSWRAPSAGERPRWSWPWRCRRWPRRTSDFRLSTLVRSGPSKSKKRTETKKIRVGFARS